MFYALPEHSRHILVPRAQTVQEAHGLIKGKPSVLRALLERTRPARAAPAQATAWGVPLERSGPCRLLTALLPARLVPQARTPLPSGLPP